MARFRATITNNNSQDTFYLPEPLGGQTSEGDGEYPVQPNSSIHIFMDSQRFDKLEHNDKPDILLVLEDLNSDNHPDIDVAIDPVTQKEVPSIEDQIEAAIAQGRQSGLATRQGVATLSSGNTFVTVDFVPDMDTADYEVHVTPKEDLAAATNFWVPDGSIQQGQFNINVDADPTQDVDFAWRIIRNTV